MDKKQDMISPSRDALETGNLNRLQKRMDDLWGKYTQLEQAPEQLTEAEAVFGELRDLLREYSLRAEYTESALEACESAKQALEQQYTSLEKSNEFCLAELSRTKEDLAYYQGRVAALTSSTSWKITAPFRFITRSIRRVIGKSARFAFRIAKRLLRKKTAAVSSRSASAYGKWPPNVSKAPMDREAESVSVSCNRLGIYTIYDKDGVVDGYIVHFLKALSAWTGRLVVVCNGTVNEEGRAQLENLGCEVLCRENTGFDAWGVKAGLTHVGFDALADYDEVIISNNTLFGPVSDMTPMFETMSARKVDFWGIASHEGMKDMDPFKCNPYGYIPEHIQSYFYAVRGRLLQSEAFRKFWENLPELNNYNAAVGLYETVMTKFFSDAGYLWDCYMDRELYYGMTDNPLIAMPMESVRDWNCPFFKRRAFFQDYDYLTTFTGQQSASCLLQFLQEETDYPTDLIWENLIRTCHMSDLVENLHLSRIFDRENSYALPESPAMKAALFMHIYDHTMAPELAGYASSLPQEADIYISTVSEEKKTAIAKAFEELPNRVEIRVLPNRGRDVSALLASFKDVVMNYDLACVTHDKKTGYLKPQTVGEGFAYMGYENILGGSTFVLQVLQAFAEDPRLGLLYAPDPNHADFASHIGLEWGANYACTKQLAQDLNLQAPMDEKHPPMAPFGSSFWFRTKAMAPLFAKDWTYDDFPPEPFNMTDGSILHAIERIYPYAAQHAGYYSAMLATADYASVDIGNLFYYAQGYAHVCYENGISNRYITVRDLCNMQLGEVVVPELPTAQAQPAGKKRSLLRRALNKARVILSRWADE